MCRERSIGPVSEEQIKVTEIQSGISEVQAHPFSFGFRYAIRTGELQILYNSSSDRWSYVYRSPQVEDPTWHGNCVNDAILSASALRSRLGDTAEVRIQRFVSDNFLETGHNLDHYRALVVAQDIGIVRQVDHSQFFQEHVPIQDSLNPEWYDLSSQEEAYLNFNAEHTRRGDLSTGLGYTEFSVRGRTGLSYLVIRPDGKNNFTLGIQLVIPGIEGYPPVSFIPYSVPVSARKDDLIEYIQHDPKYQEKYFSTDSIAIPTELRAAAQSWFLEAANALPLQR